MAGDLRKFSDHEAPFGEPYYGLEHNQAVCIKARGLGADNFGVYVVPAAHSPIVTATDAATVSFSLARGDMQEVTLGGNRTLALANTTGVRQFSLILNQDATGSRTVTWFSTIRWAGGSAPTLTTTAGKSDVLSFVQLTPGVYLGFITGQNL